MTPSPTGLAQVLGAHHASEPCAPLCPCRSPPPSSSGQFLHVLSQAFPSAALAGARGGGIRSHGRHGHFQRRDTKPAESEGDSGISSCFEDPGSWATKTVLLYSSMQASKSKIRFFPHIHLFCTHVLSSCCRCKSYPRHTC